MLYSYLLPQLCMCTLIFNWACNTDKITDTVARKIYIGFRKLTSQSYRYERIEGGRNYIRTEELYLAFLKFNMELSTRFLRIRVLIKSMNSSTESQNLTKLTRKWTSGRKDRLNSSNLYKIILGNYNSVKSYYYYDYKLS